MSPKTKRILLFKVGPIGDVIMASPIIESAARRHPESRVTWLVGASLAPLIRRMRPEPEVITVDDASLWTGNMARRMGLIIHANRILAGRSFDLGLFCHTNRRLRVLAAAAQVAEWRSFTATGRRPHPVPGRRHHDEHVRLLAGCDDGTAESAHFPGVVRRPPHIDLPARPHVALCPGGAKNPLREDVLRRWPILSYAAVARGLLARGVGVVLVGGPTDTWVRSAFEGLPVIDAIGGTTVDEALDLFSACQAVIAHDSGPMHIADLAGVPIVALFGPTSPAEKGPLGPASKVIWGGAGLACRPCYDGIGYAPCAANVCLRSITPEQVISSVLDFIV